MARKKKTPNKIYAVESAYIDPLGCDSTVSYKIVRTDYLSAVVQLADCSRKIEWYFSDNECSINKINKAITMLQGFKNGLIAAQKDKK